VFVLHLFVCFRPGHSKEVVTSASCTATKTYPALCSLMHFLAFADFSLFWQFGCVCFRLTLAGGQRKNILFRRSSAQLRVSTLIASYTGGATCVRRLALCGASWTCDLAEKFAHACSLTILAGRFCADFKICCLESFRICRFMSLLYICAERAPGEASFTLLSKAFFSS